jgi:hypothetical protein
MTLSAASNNELASINFCRTESVSTLPRATASSATIKSFHPRGLLPWAFELLIDTPAPITTTRSLRRRALRTSVGHFEVNFPHPYLTQFDRRWRSGLQHTALVGRSVRFARRHVAQALQSARESSAQVQPLRTYSERLPIRTRQRLAMPALSIERHGQVFAICTDRRQRWASSRHLIFSRHTVERYSRYIPFESQHLLVGAEENPRSDSFGASVA